MKAIKNTHVTVETRNYKNTLGFWQALGFRIEEVRGPNGYRTCQLISDDAEVVQETSGMEGKGGPRLHLRMPNVQDALKRLTTEINDVKIHSAPKGPHWRKGWIRVEDPDGNIYAMEDAKRAN